MLTKEQQTLLDQLLSSASHEQKIWLAGYLQGQIGGQIGTGASAPIAADKPKVMIYYATETGNSKGLSLQLMKAVKAAGYKVKNAAVNRLKVKDIKADTIALFLCSTHGEGDPPESALKFFAEVSGADDNALKGLDYAVCGLGDSSYEIFCGAATDLDKELQRLGGTAFQENALFDVDYASHTPKWIEDTVAAMDKLVGADASANSAPALSIASDEPIVRTGKGYTRLEPVIGTVKQIVNLNDIDSNKETYHIEIEYEDEIIYTCGDAAGIIVPDDRNQGDVTPRLYSIASSPSFHEEEVHLTVALATYKQEDGETGYGIYSKYLSELKEGDEISFYISQNQIFNLPANDNSDIIMIGPGTGIAPFRSFVYERSERGAEGKNWLIFGDQHAHCDFLYQTEWQEHVATDTLQKIDLAFSRDQEQKIYVQDRLKENAAELIQWIDNGAHIYLCGNKDPMCKDVDAALIEIIADKKSLSPEAAEDFLAELEENNRYVKDVY